VTFRAHRYPPNWKAIRDGIVLRGNNACETCRAPSRELIVRGCKGGRDEGTYMLPHGEVFDAETGEYRGLARGSEYDGVGIIQVVLTVAHLDHDPKNLRSWCQYHHLKHDAADNARRRRENKSAASGQLPLLPKS
jgi:hypothetical protein